MGKSTKTRVLGSGRIDAASLAIGLARAADEKLGEDIVILDLRGKSPVTDYFVVVTANNPRQQDAIVGEIAGKASELGERPYGKEGVGAARWALLDYIDVVVHVFGKDWRELYDLELLWGDAPRVEWRQDLQ